MSEQPAAVATEVEEGPDPNDVRRQAKRMFTEFQYRQKYRRIDFYKPNEKQRLFHNTIAREKALRAGNQLGKTQAAGAQMTFDALAFYPGWYQGRRFLERPKIERTEDFLGWAACTTQGKTRDGAQVKLLGDIRTEKGLGTGLIPLDNIVGRPTMARGISDFVDTVRLTRETGGNALIRFKTYEMDREAFQGEAVDVIWLDEDISRYDDTIYGECVARLVTTRGMIMCSLSPLLGMSPLRKRFKERSGNGECADIVMTIHDAAVSAGGHVPDADIPAIIGGYKLSERATRAFGADMQGEGSVFDTPVEVIKHTRQIADFPTYWPWLWGVDFRHSGAAEGGHPFAAVLAVRDPDNDVIYIVHALRLHGLAPVHVAAMRSNPMRNAPVAWPHDGGRGAGIVSGETIAATYKKLGLNMRPEHATFTGGGYNFEAGIAEMEHRFAGGRLKIAAHLTEAFDEYQNYHRVAGLVNKIDDDIMSAIRVVCMDIRFAKTAERFADPSLRAGPRVAQNVDFDLFNPGA